eukprot:g45786.t1
MGRGRGWGNFETGEFYVEAIRLCAPKVEYKMLLLQFAGGDIVAVEEAQDGHVAKGVGGGIKMVGKWKVVLIEVYQLKMLRETVTESALGLPNIQETASGATDSIDSSEDMQ